MWPEGHFCECGRRWVYQPARGDPLRRNRLTELPRWPQSVASLQLSVAVSSPPGRGRGRVFSGRWLHMRRSLMLALTMGTVLGLAAILAPAGSSPKALAAEGCGLRSLNGAYGYAFQGQVIPPGTTEFDAAIAGRIVFNAHGGLSGYEWDSSHGVQETLTFTGSYSVRPDCTGTATLVNSNGRTDHITLGLIEGGQEFNFTVTDPGVVITGRPTRLRLSHCTDRSLSGVFNAAASGSDFTPAGVENGDVGRFFTIHFDGRGDAFGSAPLSIPRFLSPDPLP